jgi:hypothetical protein
MTRKFRFEFDSENRILLMRFEDKRLTNESLAEVYAVIRGYAIATNPHAAIGDFSAVTQVEVTPAFIQELALEEPAVPWPSERGRIVVFPDDVGFNLACMFQKFGESTRPLLHVVRTMVEALESLGVESPLFELLP